MKQYRQKGKRRCSMKRIVILTIVTSVMVFSSI